MRISLSPLLAGPLSGVSAILEMLSLVTLSGLTVLTLRYTLMLPVWWLALVAHGRCRALAGMEPRTFGSILLPAAMVLGSATCLGRSGHSPVPVAKPPAATPLLSPIGAGPWQRRAR